MKKALIIGGGILLVIVVLGIAFVGPYFKANSYEVEVVASYEVEQAALTEWQIVVDLQTQVKVQTDSIDLSKLRIMFEESAKRVEKDGAVGATKVKPDASIIALFNATNMTSGHDLADKLMNTIDGKYGKYTDYQKTRIDRDRQYNTWLNSTISGGIAKILGFPTAAYKEKELSKTVKTSTTEETYKTKRIETPNLFKNK